MTKVQILGMIGKISTSFKSIFPLKAQVAADIETAKTAAKAYTDSQVQAATSNTTYVDEKITALNLLISTFQGGLDDKIDTKVASLGTFIGVSETYNGLPTVDQNGKAYTAGDFAHLTKNVSGHKKGLYRYDGTEYVFTSGDPAVLEILESLKYTSIDDTNDDKFITGKYLKDREDANAVTQEEIDDAVGIPKEMVTFTLVNNQAGEIVVNGATPVLAGESKLIEVEKDSHVTVTYQGNAIVPTSSDAGFQATGNDYFMITASGATLNVGEPQIVGSGTLTVNNPAGGATIVIAMAGHNFAEGDEISGGSSKTYEDVPFSTLITLSAGGNYITPTSESDGFQLSGDGFKITKTGVVVSPQ